MTAKTIKIADDFSVGVKLAPEQPNPANPTLVLLNSFLTDSELYRCASLLSPQIMSANSARRIGTSMKTRS
jgi:hypothetical protein